MITFPRGVVVSLPALVQCNQQSCGVVCILHYQSYHSDSKCPREETDRQTHPSSRKDVSIKWKRRHKKETKGICERKR